MISQKLFGIELFKWKEWDEIETGFLQFHNVEFPYESMKKYNGMDVALNMDGEIMITNDLPDGLEGVWSGYAYEIPEFMDELNKKARGDL